MDKLSIERISKLHPKLRAEATNILSEVDKLLTGNAICRFAFTLRTFAEQQAIYDQGRTKPGKIVTKAKPGSSMHNYGLAIDIVLLVDKDKNGTYEEASWDSAKDWDGDKTADWLEIVKVFEKYGWTWGGRWRTFKDLPHFEKTFGHTWQSLFKLRSEGKVDKEGYVLI